MRIYRAERRRLFTARWRGRFADAVEGLACDATPAARSDEQWLLVLYCAHARTVRGEAGDRLREFALRAGVGEAARRDLGRRSLRRRLVALRAIAALRDGSAWDALLALADGGNPWLALGACQAMAAIDPVLAAPTVVPLLARRGEWSVAQVAATLRDASSPELGARVAEAAARGGADVRRRLVRHLVHVAPESALPAARRILGESAEEDVVADCVRILGHFRDPVDLPTVRRFLGHPSARLRARAAGALAGLGRDEDVPRIEALLSDPDWWVRRDAAGALVRLPWGGRARAEELARSHGDPAVRDVLLLALGDAR